MDETGVELYDEEEFDCLEEHIEKYFGAYDGVFHEIYSPDIHVDICIIPPQKERNFYTLVTMGMGAHKMNVPQELKGKQLELAELLITLPPDWEISNEDERWYWPIRWLKTLARLPGNNNTWLGWGHTVPNGEPFADNTLLCGILLDFPYAFGEESMECKLPKGEVVNFYQMLPLYEQEMNFKIGKGTEALTALFGDDFSDVVDVGRKNYCAFINNKKQQS